MSEFFEGMGLNQISKKCHADNVKAGWWSDEDLHAVAGMVPENGDDSIRKKHRVMLLATKLCLVHSEVSEALEGIRKDIPDDHLPNRSMFEVEIADTFIRLFDLAGATGIDLDGAIEEKILYNRQRADHKKENRDASGGKTI